ncbi:BUD32 family EKC/KEOPS complex subunit [Metapseudomonas otitidis]|uniref:toluene tolerance protein n=1 Tax=Metapseudomonas otitidis TaxID=319939 RepID=UPI001AAEEC12|nr:toluene tolerance protein [Pseudomonas otitidis]MBO2925857.1 toluene tolerance protein [Pseudomonas otitidis]
MPLKEILLDWLNPLEKIQSETYHQLCNGATVLERDSYGEKVLLLKDGSIIKLFRLKHIVSSALFYPYAKRFSDNVKKLKDLDIACPSVIGVYRVKSIDRDAVHYQPVPGKNLRHFRNTQEKCPSDLFYRLGCFIGKLHNTGIYFRSLHLGNIILMPSGEFGLIDIADLQYQKKPLSKLKATRNFRHLLRDPQDKRWLTSNEFGDFFAAYRTSRKIK